jgi:hypothetical protein
VEPKKEEEEDYDISEDSYCGIYLMRLRKTMKNISLDSQ